MSSSNSDDDEFSEGSSSSRDFFEEDDLFHIREPNIDSDDSDDSHDSEEEEEGDFDHDLSILSSDGYPSEDEIMPLFKAQYKDALQGISRYAFMNRIRPLLDSRDRPEQPHLFAYDFHHQLRDCGKKRIGEMIASSPSLYQMSMKFTEEEPQSVNLVFQGPFDGVDACPGHGGGREEQREYKLRRFKICGNNENLEFIKLTPRDWGCISQYLQVTKLLCHVDLSQLRLDTKSAEALASALGVVKLRSLSLTGLEISDEDLALLFTSMDVSRLDELDVVSCGVRRCACKAIAENILCDKVTQREMRMVHLQVLNLENSPIDDDCVRDLCRGLENNIHLQHLCLRDCADISDDGWTLFDKLVYNTTSLEGLYKSNHKLQSIAGHPQPDLILNSRKGMYSKNRGHDKIIHHLVTTDDHLDDSKFNIEPFVEYNVEMMPHIIGFFATMKTVGVLHTRAPLKLLLNMKNWFVYEIIRCWNPKELFSFPSAEKTRLSVDMDKLQSRNRDLERENELLKLEVKMLKSKKQPTDDELGGVSKRVRHG